MIFRQLYDANTSTYTYLIGDEAPPRAALVAPVREQRRTLGDAAAGWARSAPLVMVCRSGNRSASAAAELARWGFERVFNLQGRRLDWRAQGFDVISAGAQGS